MNKRFFLACIGILFALQLSAKEVVIKGTVYDGTGAPLPGALVQLAGTRGEGAVADIDGKYIIEGLSEGNYTLVVSNLGFLTDQEKVNATEGGTFNKDFSLKEDLLNLEQVVVTGTRERVPTYRAPVIVSKISPKLFESTQSLSLSEGLAFSPGLRVETNCQNCGFSQLRMNGLEGAYSQILINSRPIYSALMGVYGLDMIPANMIDRVEVVKGGGSALYGGSAIGGTINIITKDPVYNYYEAGINQAFTDMKASDRTITANGSIVSKDLTRGLSFFANSRTRKPWDANGDGFSEMTKLDNNTFGFNSFWRPTEYSKLNVKIDAINEFRRGGNKFDLEPHQTDITEQLDHKIIGSDINYEQYTRNRKHKFSIYNSTYDTKRKSYYGGGGRVLKEGDTFTNDDLTALNAYGRSKDLSSVSGIQYSYDINDQFILSAGGEYQHNKVVDEMPGYLRGINQKVNTMGSYLQLEVKPIEALTLLFGGRYDNVNIDGEYKFGTEMFNIDKNLGVFVPRASAMFDVNKDVKLRLSYAQGYRAPQAFDEDLHIETVGGDAVFIKMSPNLKVEKSNNITGSFNYTKKVGDLQTNLVLEGFYTKINNPFVSEELDALPSGVKLKEKKNGDGVKVLGANLELNFAYTRKFLAQLGFTMQKSKYTKAEAVWEPEEGDTRKATFTDIILRTPNNYGFFSFTYKPVEPLSLSWSGVYTGKMSVPHVLDPDTEYTVVKETPTFFENNFKISYDWDVTEDYCIELFAGLQNAFNSFQTDFDKGSDRDAGYIYGPRRPRTVFMGLKFSFNK